MTRHINERQLEDAVSRLKAVQPSASPSGVAASLLEELIMIETPMLEHPTSTHPTTAKLPRRRVWLAAIGTAAALATFGAVFLPGGTPSASAALGAAASATDQVPALHATFTSTQDSGTLTSEMDVNGSDLSYVTDAVSWGEKSHSEIRLVDGVTYEKSGDSTWASLPDDQRVTSFGQASADVVRTVIDNGKVVRAGTENGQTTYRVSITDKLVEDLGALPDGVTRWFGLKASADGATASGNWLSDLSITVDEASGIISAVHVAGTEGTSDLAFAIPSTPVAIEAPITN